MTDASVIAYETYAHEFIACRSPTIGAKSIERWAHSLAPGSTVLELACGSGCPVTETLLAAGLHVSAIDSSPTLIAEVESRFPDLRVRCERVQDGSWFDRTFDAVVSIGLLFLLEEEDQLSMIKRVATTLKPGGRFLFTAPVEIGTWDDALTGHPCRSLGLERYCAALDASKISLLRRFSDSGGNNHYDSRLG
ncbi:MAG: class I SAM-dependent methyltransferase [Pseudomonadota bacterium]